VEQPSNLAFIELIMERVIDLYGRNLAYSVPFFLLRVKKEMEDDLDEGYSVEEAFKRALRVNNL
jgi:hypothetical protein